MRAIRRLAGAHRTSFASACASTRMSRTVLNMANVFFEELRQTTDKYQKHQQKHLEDLQSELEGLLLRQQNAFEGHFGPLATLHEPQCEDKMQCRTQTVYTFDLADTSCSVPMLGFPHASEQGADDSQFSRLQRFADQFSASTDDLHYEHCRKWRSKVYTNHFAIDESTEEISLLSDQQRGFVA